MLIDTGWEVDDRDAQRILAATQHAGLKRIDHLVISHCHADHVGGLAALSKMIPIGRFYGRGDEIEPVNQKWFDSYRTAAAGSTFSANPRSCVSYTWLARWVRCVHHGRIFAPCSADDAAGIGAFEHVGCL